MVSRGKCYRIVVSHNPGPEWTPAEIELWFDAMPTVGDLMAAAVDEAEQQQLWSDESEDAFIITLAAVNEYAQKYGLPVIPEGEVLVAHRVGGVEITVIEEPFHKVSAVVTDPEESDA